jgi:oligoendopeptidase F
MIATQPTRRFVPADFDAADVEQVVRLHEALLARPLDTAADAERWLGDLSELAAAVDEYGSRRYIDKSCHTDDERIQKAYLHFVENVEPKIKPLAFRIHKKFLDSPGGRQLHGTRYDVLRRQWQAWIELYRDENVPLQTELTKLTNEYDKVCGAMMVEFRGKEYTLQQLNRFIEEPDRPTRQAAWELSTKRRLQDREAIEGIFDRMLPMRQQMARNAGMSDFRAFQWKAYNRFDYTPQDCLTFADAVAETCVPLMREVDERRRRDLGVDRLRPWDLTVDPKGRPPLRPFEESNINGFVDSVRTIFGRLSPRLADDFESLRTNRNLDLQSRKGKQPGGYQCSLEEAGQPFVFMNAAGMHDDVVTLLHEGGHAFHCLAARGEPLVFLRSAPIEFAEVASMSMELLGADHYDVIYPGAAEAARAKRMQLERVVDLLPWVATIDSFQHWIYTHPGHTREQRTAEWLRLMDRFGNRLDWTGHDDARAARWQAQLHLFHLPFYYIEYGIAQLGALQLWMKAKQDPHGALAGYRAALALGGTRPLPELFAAAGIAFDFSPKTLGPLIAAVGEELRALPT